ncbi:MotA/TolQ/ExbB proton channel family protein, partial [Oleiphilus sp. HI0079]|uniref:MotA/TolQ/ExbB proton channel family protein n=2 Tax=Oleiphilus TaxID=141450 RepID=UPI0009EE7AC5
MDTVVKFFQDGGSFMYPIAVVLAIGLAIAVERFIFLTGAKSTNRRVFEDELLPLLLKNEFIKAGEKARKGKAAISTMLDIGLTRHNAGRPRDEIEYAMEESLMEILPRLEKRTPYLAMLANVATLLGLLGTIIGLIAAFTAVANADPAQKANL